MRDLSETRPFRRPRQPRQTISVITWSSASYELASEHRPVLAVEPALRSRCAIVGHDRPNSAQSGTVAASGSGMRATAADATCGWGNDEQGADEGRSRGRRRGRRRRRRAGGRPRGARGVGPAGDRGAPGALARAGTRPGWGPPALAGRRLAPAPGHSRPGATGPAGGLARAARRADRGAFARHAPVCAGGRRAGLHVPGRDGPPPRRRTCFAAGLSSLSNPVWGPCSTGGSPDRGGLATRQGPGRAPAAGLVERRAAPGDPPGQLVGPGRFPGDRPPPAGGDGAARADRARPCLARPHLGRGARIGSGGGALRAAGHSTPAQGLGLELAGRPGRVVVPDRSEPG